MRRFHLGIKICAGVASLFFFFPTAQSDSSSYNAKAVINNVIYDTGCATTPETMAQLSNELVQLEGICYLKSYWSYYGGWFRNLIHGDRDEGISPFEKSVGTRVRLKVTFSPEVAKGQTVLTHLRIEKQNYTNWGNDTDNPLAPENVCRFLEQNVFKKMKSKAADFQAQCDVGSRTLNLAITRK